MVTDVHMSIWDAQQCLKSSVAWMRNTARRCLVKSSATFPLANIYKDGYTGRALTPCMVSHLQNAIAAEYDHVDISVTHAILDLPCLLQNLVSTLVLLNTNMIAMFMAILLVQNESQPDG
ncbi:TPA: hypothetical protein ACH3X1_014708 [Trebouxia sp. C0004]